MSMYCRGLWGTHKDCPGYEIKGIGVNQTREKCSCSCHENSPVDMNLPSWA